MRLASCEAPRRAGGERGVQRLPFHKVAAQAHRARRGCAAHQGGEWQAVQGAVGQDEHTLGALMAGVRHPLDLAATRGHPLAQVGFAGRNRVRRERFPVPAPEGPTTKRRDAFSPT